MFLIHAFIAFIYQPFLNILVFFYWAVSRLSPTADMGMAVILLTVIIRILLLPLSLAEDQSEHERRQMHDDLEKAHSHFAADPIRQRQETKQVFHRNRGVVIAEVISLLVQVALSLMLWKMFDTGLKGEDLHLLYPFTPHPPTPYNLVFLGKFDLGHPNLWLNIAQSVMIFIVESLNIITSPYPPRPGEVVRLQLVLPVLSFFIFLALPAGKKLFIITTLAISLVLIIYKFIRRKIHEAQAAEKEAEEAKAAAEAAAMLPTLQPMQAMQTAPGQPIIYVPVTPKPTEESHSEAHH
jgi:YidC/Oxa1 family membrane protein insertase